MSKFIQNIFSIRNQRKHKVLTIFGLKLKIKSKMLVLKNDFTVKTNRLENKVKRLEIEHKNLDEKLRRLTIKSNIHEVQTHIVEHCNLNCKGCSHFSNIAQEEENLFYTQNVLTFAQ